MKKQFPLVINLRGNNGSGKSTVARDFMANGRNMEDLGNAYRFKMPGSKRPWVVLGKYTTACGGVDRIRTSNEVLAMLQKYAIEEKCNIFMEGVLMSTFYGTIGTFSQQFEDRWIFAYLDTPIEVCLKRIVARRKKAKNDKPFDPQKQVYPRHKQINTSRLNIEQTYHRRTITVNHRDPLPILLKLASREG